MLGHKPGPFPPFADVYDSERFGAEAGKAKGRPQDLPAALPVAAVDFDHLPFSLKQFLPGPYGGYRSFLAPPSDDDALPGLFNPSYFIPSGVNPRRIVFSLITLGSKNWRR